MKQIEESDHNIGIMGHLIKGRTRMISIYGIAHCDTVKKARKFLEEHNLSYEFCDFKKQLPTKAQINKWSEFVGELPINKKGTTYRKFKEEYDQLNNDEKIDFIQQHASMIKRPILEKQHQVLIVGFQEDQYKKLLLID